MQNEMDKFGYICEFYHNVFNHILINYPVLYSVEHHKKYMIYKNAIIPANGRVGVWSDEPPIRSQRFTRNLIEDDSAFC